MRVNISEQLLNKINLLSSEYNIEVGGYLTGEVKNGEVYLTDLLIPEQDITSVSVTITPQAQIDLRRKYGVDVVSKIIGHWHSHHSMGCFWSGTDRQNMDGIMLYKDLFVFIVSSKGNHLVRVCLRKPLRADFEECSIYLKTKRLDILRKQIDKLISKNRDVPSNNSGEDSYDPIEGIDFNSDSDKDNSERESENEDSNNNDDEKQEELSYYG